MKKWISEKSTWAGILAAVLAGLQAYIQEPNILTAVIAALSAVLLIMRESPKTPPLVMLLVLGLFGCKSIPVPENIQADTAQTVCFLIDASGCYEELRQALPALTKDTCSETVSAIATAAEKIQSIYNEKGADTSIIDVLGEIPPEMVNKEFWDPTSMDISKIRNGKCRSLASALGVR